MKKVILASVILLGLVVGGTVGTNHSENVNVADHGTWLGGTKNIQATDHGTWLGMASIGTFDHGTWLGTTSIKTASHGTWLGGGQN